MTFYNIKSSAADVMATLENVAMKRNTKHGLAGLLDPCEWLEFEPKQIRSDFIQRVEQLRQAAS